MGYSRAVLGNWFFFQDVDFDTSVCRGCVQATQCPDTIVQLRIVQSQFGITRTLTQDQPLFLALTALLAGFLSIVSVFIGIYAVIDSVWLWHYKRKEWTEVAERQIITERVCSCHSASACSCFTNVQQTVVVNLTSETRRAMHSYMRLLHRAVVSDQYSRLVHKQDSWWLYMFHQMATRTSSGAFFYSTLQVRDRERHSSVFMLTVMQGHGGNAKDRGNVSNLELIEFVLREHENSVFVYELIGSDYSDDGDLRDPFDSIKHVSAKNTALAAAASPTFQRRWHMSFPSMERAIRQFWAVEKLPAPPCPLLRRIVHLTHIKSMPYIDDENGLDPYKTSNLPMCDHVDCKCFFCCAARYEDLVSIECAEYQSPTKHAKAEAPAEWKLPPGALDSLRVAKHKPSPSMECWGPNWFEWFKYNCLGNCIGRSALTIPWAPLVDIVSNPAIVSKEKLLAAAGISRGMDTERALLHSSVPLVLGRDNSIAAHVSMIEESTFYEHPLRRQRFYCALDPAMPVPKGYSQPGSDVVFNSAFDGEVGGSTHADSLPTPPHRVHTGGNSHEEGVSRRTVRTQPREQRTTEGCAQQHGVAFTRCTFRNSENKSCLGRAIPETDFCENHTPCRECGLPKYSRGSVCQACGMNAPTNPFSNA